ncbi:unnamed protein product [Symbiodinium natans]|uniref:Uncharacterized protein n=1 Tax=Symbiodinium natans TaxID=878477 RepID=A0A812NCW6_9DINO|nr:unnamed protein product [Symbiodinium natans]
MWQPHLEYLKEERYDPIVPVQLRKMPAKPKRIRILAHEVALERGDTWQEGAQRRGLRLWNKMKPPGPLGAGLTWPFPKAGGGPKGLGFRV